MAGCGYHFTVKPVSFGKGQSAVHTAAYNAREQLEDERQGGKTKDYGKSGETLFSGIFAPKDAPEWAHDREELWNRAEDAERQQNGRPARNVTVAFPHQLDEQQREWLIKDFAREQFARKDMIADVNIHAPDEAGDQRNYHAHILLTMRKLDGDEFSKTKCREWNSKEQLGEWREQWAQHCGNALERAGHEVEAERWRHGHEALSKQREAAEGRGDKEFVARLEEEATRHKGPNVTAMERRAAAGDRGDEQRDLAERHALRAEMRGIDREISEQEKAQRLAGDLYDKGDMASQQGDALRQINEHHRTRQQAEKQPRRDGRPEAGDDSAVYAPEPEHGFTRMYRGIGNNVGEAKSGDALHFTTNRSRSESYGRVHYVDVAPAEMAKFDKPYVSGPGMMDWLTSDASIISRLKPLEKERDDIAVAKSEAKADREISDARREKMDRAQGKEKTDVGRENTDSKIAPQKRGGDDDGGGGRGRER